VRGGGSKTASLAFATTSWSGRRQKKDILFKSKTQKTPKNYSCLVATCRQTIQFLFSSKNSNFFEITIKVEVKSRFLA
jgi:hypothetical protein